MKLSLVGHTWNPDFIVFANLRCACQLLLWSAQFGKGLMHLDAVVTQFSICGTSITSVVSLEGQDQGNSVGLVQSFTPGAGYMVNLLWIQDKSLKDWLLSDHGHGNLGRYDLARSNSLDLTVTRGKPPVQPIGT